MSTKQGAQPAPLSRTRERLLENYERVFRMTGGIRMNPTALDDRQIGIAVEDEMFRARALPSRCGCGVTVYRIPQAVDRLTLNYDGSVHACRRKAERKPDLYDRTLRGLNRGRP